MRLYSVALFRRYYLKSTLIDADILKMMNACIILGAKLSEVNMSREYMDRFYSMTKINKEGRHT